MGAAARKLPETEPGAADAAPACIAPIQALNPPTPHRFRAHARNQGRHFEHAVPGAATLQDAAIVFAEHWVAEADAGEVSVVVRDLDTGEQSCFVIDLASGETEPCG